MKKLANAVLLLLLPASAAGQPLPCAWENEFSRPGLDDRIEMMTVFDDGNGAALYAAGRFSFAGGVAAHRVARWDGNAWSALGDGTDDVIHALAVFDDGNGPALYAGGAFTSAGGVFLTHGIARWDGTNWSSVGNGLTSGVVDSLHVFDDGSGPALFVGGLFSTVGGVSASNIAKWDGASWSALGSGLSSRVYALETFDDARGDGPALHAGGVFSGRVDKWDGTTWLAAGNISGAVYALEVFDEGQGFGPALFAGGDINGHIAKWDGLSWDIPSHGTNSTVRALKVFDDGSGPALFLGGSFIRADSGPSVNARYVARWDGTSWSELSTGMDHWVYALAVFDDGNSSALYAGGRFSTAGDVVANGLAKWDGTAWSNLRFGDVGEGVNGEIRALGQFGSVLYAGGDFTITGTSLDMERVAGWNGNTWTGLGAGLNNTVRAVAVFDDGSGPALYAGGAFTSAGLIPVSYIAKWDGAAWQPVGTGMNDEVHALAVFDDGNGPALYAGGEFSMAGSVDARHFAKWDGTNWSNPGTGPTVMSGP